MAMMGYPNRSVIDDGSGGASGGAMLPPINPSVIEALKAAIVAALGAGGAIASRRARTNATPAPSAGGGVVDNVRKAALVGMVPSMLTWSAMARRKRPEWAEGEDPGQNWVDGEAEKAARKRKPPQPPKGQVRNTPEQQAQVDKWIADRIAAWEKKFGRKYRGPGFYTRMSTPENEPVIGPNDDVLANKLARDQAEQVAKLNMELGATGTPPPPEPPPEGEPSSEKKEIKDEAEWRARQHDYTKDPLFNKLKAEQQKYWLEREEMAKQHMGSNDPRMQALNKRIEEYNIKLDVYANGSRGYGWKAFENAVHRLRIVKESLSEAPRNSVARGDLLRERGELQSLVRSLRQIYRSSTRMRLKVPLDPKKYEELSKYLDYWAKEKARIDAQQQVEPGTTHWGYKGKF